MGDSGRPRAVERRRVVGRLVVSGAASREGARGVEGTHPDAPPERSGREELLVGTRSRQ